MADLHRLAEFSHHQRLCPRHRRAPRASATKAM